MKKKETRKILKLSSETLGKLEKDAATFGDLEGTQASGPGCCP